jgi:hypothetical protein
MLPNIQCNAHIVTVRYISVRAVANSCSRRLFCEGADRYSCAVVGVPMVYDLSVLGRERKKDSCSQYVTYVDQWSTILGTRALCKNSIWGFRSDSFLTNMLSTSVKGKVTNKGLPPLTEQSFLGNTAFILSVTVD